MIISPIALSDVDKQVLFSYAKCCEGLSNYLGKNYEIVLHSLEDFDHSAIKVLNGFHTNRSEGAPITDLALNMLSAIRNSTNPADHISYFTTNKLGAPMKSTTIVIRGENDRIIGLLCINFYLNATLFDTINDLMDGARSSRSEEVQRGMVKEVFVENSSELINNSVERIRSEIYNNPTVPTKLKNREIIRSLNDLGIFRLKDSVARVADAMNISKNTVYLHLHNLSNAGEATIS